MQFLGIIHDLLIFAIRVYRFSMRIFWHFHIFNLSLESSQFLLKMYRILIFRLFVQWLIFRCIAVQFFCKRSVPFYFTSNLSNFLQNFVIWRLNQLLYRPFLGVSLLSYDTSSCWTVISPFNWFAKFTQITVSKTLWQEKF